MTILFEWDYRKRASKLEKYGLDFTRAIRIFSNPIIEWRDDREDYGEDRWIAIGRWQTNHMVIVYTWRGQKRRIISAWKAGRHDQRIYQDRFDG